MSIKDELDSELKDAMRSQDRNRIDVIRQINTEVARAIKSPGFNGAADDELYRDMISSYTKKMSKALVEYESYGERGRESAEKLRYEVDYLKRWLPRALSIDEVSVLVDAAVEEIGAEDIKAMGQVMAHLMKQQPGLDGKTASRLVRARLSSD